MSKPSQLGQKKVKQIDSLDNLHHCATCFTLLHYCPICQGFKTDKYLTLCHREISGFLRIFKTGSPREVVKLLTFLTIENLKTVQS